jgi:hypothetical protein
VLEHVARLLADENSGAARTGSHLLEAAEPLEGPLLVAPDWKPPR